jgi:beta-N-acetylhexosaminidase
MRLLFAVVKTIAALTCLVGAAYLRAPEYAMFRPWPLWGLLAVAGLIALLSRNWRAHRWELVPFAAAMAALLMAAMVEGRFQLARRAVLNADPVALEKLGRHIIVGFDSWTAVRALVERRAVGGVFVTKRNVAGLDAAAITREIAALQAIRAAQKLPPLWIATDQEGGGVSRLSPPLPRQPTLGATIRGLAKPGLEGDQRRAAVAAYATTQGQGIAALGINLNFAPVVDLDHGVHNPNDAYTRIGTRAISSDPAVVAEVASAYCDGLAAAGVLCTLKHFPGLGRVFEDTHLSEGVLKATAAELAATDWVPFRWAAKHAGAVMVGHVRAPALDATQPVSTSAAAINGVLRREWGYQGLVITDDMCMGAIHGSRDGIAKASVRALNAGVDLLLISWDGEQLYPVLAELLTMHQSGGSAELNVALGRSAARLAAAQAGLRR